MRILNIVESAYRGSLEEQDDTILWLSRALRNAGAELAVLLRGNAVNYATSQECPALQIGSAGVKHPARPNEDLARLQDKAVKIYAVRDDIDERGIDLSRCVPGVELVGRRDIASVFEEYDQIWHW